MMKRLFVGGVAVGLLVIMVILSGCNTARGFKRDMLKGWSSIKRSVK